MKPIRLSITTLRILRIFLSATAALSGSDIAKQTGTFSGTLYPALLRLEHAGWLKSAWEDVDASKVGRPRKRLYRLTAPGLKAAAKALEEFK